MKLLSDARGAVRIASSDATIAPFDSTTLEKLESKHPKTPLDRRVYPQNVNATLIVNEDDVYKAVMSFAPGSAGGTTCLRPQHVKDCLSDKLGQDASNLKSALTEFVNLLLSGKVPDRIKPLIAGANFSAFNKPNGGLRTFAVGDTLRRVAGKCAASIASSKFKSYFAPLQVGFGTRGGAEAAVHAVRAFIKSANENDVLLKLDFSNAFNHVKTDYVAELLAEEMAELLPFYRLCYEQGSFLPFGEGFLVSEEGFQQGDPLVVFLFCLSIHRFIVRLKARLKIAYIDDITKCDDWKIVIGDLRLVMVEIEKFGLSLNNEKCEIVFFSSNHEFCTKVTNEFNLLCPRIKTVQDSEIELLGSALGPISIETIFSQKLKAILLMKERLKHVSSHCALFLLKNCFLLPKLMYFFLTSEVYRRTDLLLTLENTIIKIKIDVAVWRQASLPAYSGGLGILPPTKLAVVSYLSSFLSVEDLAQQVYAFSQTDIITDALTSFDAFTADRAPRDLLNSAKYTTKSRKNKLASFSRKPQPMTPPDYMELLV